MTKVFPILNPHAVIKLSQYYVENKNMIAERIKDKPDCQQNKKYHPNFLVHES